MAGHVGDLDHVGAALHCGGHSARPQPVAGKGRSLEREFGGSGVWRIPPDPPIWPVEGVE